MPLLFDIRANLFLSLKKSPLVVTPAAYRRAAYYIGQYLRQTGNRSIYSYKVYYNAQKLDPKYKNNPEPTYTMNWSKTSTNPYVHMSIGFGKAGVTFNKDGSILIKDRYDFVERTAGATADGIAKLDW